MVIPGVLIALTVHELCHGFTAYLMGDNTAKAYGRLTLNPVSHIDILGLLCMIFAGIGWAKPVPVNPSQLKVKNKKLGMAVVALAGPLSNVVLAFIFLVISFVLILNSSGNVAMAAASFLFTTARLSIGLAAFNLLPIPPLDGSKIVMPLLPNKVTAWLYQYEGYIRFAMLAVLLLGFLDGPIMSITSGITMFLYRGVGLLLTLFGV